MFLPLRQRVGRKFFVLVCSCIVSIVYFVLILETPRKYNGRVIRDERDNTRRPKKILVEEKNGETNSCCSHTSRNTSRDVVALQSGKIDSDVNISLPSVPTCPPVVNGRFQPINDQHMYVYSAYFEEDYEGVPVIRLIGTSLRSRIPVYCHLYEMDQVEIKVGKMFTFPDSHRKVTSSASYYFLCHLQQGRRPQFVSLTTNVTKAPTYKLQVHYPGRRLRNITVCHAVLHGPYKNPSQLIQSIEINRALGVDHTFIYNFSISEEINLVLRQYVKDGVLTVIQWPLPYTTDAWYYAQSAAINDCVYRNKIVSEYVVILDLDEFIIPVTSTSWIDLIQDINNDYYGDKQQNKPPLGSIGFESCLFYRKPLDDVWKQIKTNLSITNEEEDFINQYSILPFLYLDRSDPPYTFPKRSKTINRPETVSIAGIHRISQHRGHPPKTEYVVSSDKAILHHYSTSAMRFTFTVTDSSTLRLKQILIPRLRRAFSRFKKYLMNNRSTGVNP